MSSNSQTLREGMLVGLCNPLLDISAATDASFLEKYDLKLNDAILAEDKHKPMYKELVAQYNVNYIAGGSGQNALRVAQKILKKPNVTVFMGCVGNDEFSKILEEKARGEGVDVKYQVTEKESTGTCAVLLTGNGANRSLCANLAAANHFTKDHIESFENEKCIKDANYYYITGFFLTVSPSTIMEVAQEALEKNKIFMMNLSAPFLSQFFKEPLMNAFPFIDILFGNETEAETFAKELKLDSSGDTMSDLALKIAALPKKNEKKPRIVIITQGKDDVIIAQGGEVKRQPAIPVPNDKIVDTNGAGDAFVGGFISQLLRGRDIDQCVKCGIWAATQIIQQDGCTLPLNLEIPAEYQDVNDCN